MNSNYYNYFAHYPQSGWDRWTFARSWWSLYDDDPYRVPPFYPTFRRALNPGRHSHLARFNFQPIYLEALPRRTYGERGFGGLVLERPVAAGVILVDRRRSDRTAYLALLRCVNDAGCLRAFLEVATEEAQRRGGRRLLGPTGLSPYIGSGLLQDYWDTVPPLHTPYNPPYLPELVATTAWSARSSARLYHLPVHTEALLDAPSPAQLTPLDPTRLAGDLLPLFAAALPNWLDFSPPDAVEAVFILRWLEPWPRWGWLAQVEDQPAGFILLQPDLAPWLRRANGGRNLLWRVWLRLAASRLVSRGRILFLEVLPKFRGRGIGRQLLRQGLAAAQQRGWQSVTIGPLPVTAPSHGFLEAVGAEARQTYQLYQRDL